MQSKELTKSLRIVITGKLQAYLDGIELAFGADTKHIQAKGFRVQPNTDFREVSRDIEGSPRSYAKAKGEGDC